MHRSWWCLMVIGSMGIASIAGAQGAPRHVLDESALYVRLWSSSPESGYVLRIDGAVFGRSNPQDAVLVDVQQRGRTIASQRCGLRRDDDSEFAGLECEIGAEPALTATGDLDVTLTYYDDVEETREPLRAMRLHVNAYPYWVRTGVMGAMYQIDGSDQLGTAFLYERHRQASFYAGSVSFYASFSGAFESGGDIGLRCRVGSERIPDRRVQWEPHGVYDVQERLSPESEIRSIGWYRARIVAVDLWWGQRERDDIPQVVFLGEHPGRWSCDLRQGGEVLRTFDFVVGPDGHVVAHSEELGPNGLRMIPALHVVDVRIPHPSPRDAIIDPEAIRRASQFGRPWSSPEGVAEMLRALPPARGSVAPSRAAGAGSGGRGSRGRRH